MNPACSTAAGYRRLSNSISIAVAESIELIDPHGMFVRKTIYGAAVGTAIKIIFIFERIAAADEANFVVNSLIRFERKYRTTRDGIEVFQRIFVARHDASGAVAVIRAVQTDYKLTAFAERFGYIGMQFDRSSLLRPDLCALNEE